MSHGKPEHGLLHPAALLMPRRKADAVTASECVNVLLNVCGCFVCLARLECNACTSFLTICVRVRVCAFICVRSKSEFYDLLKDTHAPDSLSFYDDRLSAHLTWRGKPSETPTMSVSQH